MANKILMPKLSQTMDEGQISSWVKEEGDEIEANETIAKELALPDAPKIVEGIKEVCYL